jgi:hypothetical protein
MARGRGEKSGYLMFRMALPLDDSAANLNGPNLRRIYIKEFSRTVVRPEPRGSYTGSLPDVLLAAGKG